jgi:multidrug efflux pump subunit AcrA (membrane-fusion protein)
LKRKQKMSNYFFPCASVNGLTTGQKKAAIAALRASLVADRANAKAAKAAAAEAKAAAATAKREAAIAKAQARLEKLLAKSIVTGSKAVKANKRPSKGVTYGAEANALAETIKAGKSTI